MKRAALASTVALLLGVASAHSERPATVCGKDRLGEFTDSLMYYPNAWNPRSPDDGFVCLDVYNNTPAFDATWNWDADIQDVHSFPYVRFGHEHLPMRLSSLRSIRLSTEWMYTPGSPKTPPRDFRDTVWAQNKRRLESGKIQANAAWDFFLDNDRNRTLYPQDAAIEFMVWLGRVGDPWWLGRENNSVLSNVTLGETEFSLYYGRNQGGTHVFTAVTSNGEDIVSLDEDFYPLFEYILKQAYEHPDTPNDLPRDPFLGIVEFGTETWFSDGNVTFTAANFGMELDGSSGDSNSNSRDDDGSEDGDSSDGGSGDNSGSSDADDEDNGAGLVGRSTLAYILTGALMAGGFFAYVE